MATKKDKNNYLKIGELPTLKVISEEKLLFHEEPDEERLLNLIDRLNADAELKNPPIVAKIENNDKYVILDGANRVTALVKLGFKHFPVQIIDFNDSLLKLHCWNHVVERLNKNYFLDNLNLISNIKLVKSSLETDELPYFDPEENYFCHIMFNDETGLYISGSPDVASKVELLRKIAGLYHNQSDFDRVSYSNSEHLRKHYPEFTALVTFRRFEKEEFSKIIACNEKLPAGVTRVFLPKRALGLNIPLEILKSGLTLDDKNRWLDEMIIGRVRNKAIRFYREPTFVFDE